MIRLPLDGAVEDPGVPPSGICDFAGRFVRFCCYAIQL